MPAKEIPEHKDKLGRLLKVGDCVAYPSGNTLIVGLIKKLNPKMVGVSSLGKNRSWSSAKNKYPDDCVLLDGPEVTMFLIKNSSK
jgi:hypothetical protein